MSQPTLRINTCPVDTEARPVMHTCMVDTVTGPVDRYTCLLVRKPPWSTRTVLAWLIRTSTPGYVHLPGWYVFFPGRYAREVPRLITMINLHNLMHTFPWLIRPLNRLIRGRSGHFHDYKFTCRLIRSLAGIIRTLARLIRSTRF